MHVHKSSDLFIFLHCDIIVKNNFKEVFILFFERMAQITQQNSIKIIWFLLIMIIFLVFQLSVAHNNISELRSMCYELESRIEDDYDKQMQQAHLK